MLVFGSFVAVVVVVMVVASVSSLPWSGIVFGSSFIVTLGFFLIVSVDLGAVGMPVAALAAITS